MNLEFYKDVRSPLAFVLSIELPAIKISGCKDVQGITHLDVVNSTDLEQVLKIALYADDITLFWGNEHKMSHALFIVNNSSCFRPRDKIENKIRKHSEAVLLGRKKHCTDTFHNFVWKKKSTIL